MIRLRGRVVVAPEIRTIVGTGGVIYGGVFKHYRWQRWLSRIAPRVFRCAGYEYEQATARAWIVGIPHDEIIRRYGGTR